MGVLVDSELIEGVRMVDGVSRTLLLFILSFSVLSFSVLPVVLEDKVDKSLAGMAAIRNAAIPTTIPLGCLDPLGRRFAAAALQQYRLVALQPQTRPFLLWC